MTSKSNHSSTCLSGSAPVVAGGEAWPKGSVLTKWYTGSYEDIANAKYGNMGKSKTAGLAFEKILDEFPPLFDCVKPLCRYTLSVWERGFHWNPARPRKAVWAYHQSIRWCHRGLRWKLEKLMKCRFVQVYDRSVFSGLWSRNIGYGRSSMSRRLPILHHDRSLLVATKLFIDYISVLYTEHRAFNYIQILFTWLW